jgi:hypothetical protein
MERTMDQKKSMRRDGGFGKMRDRQRRRTKQPPRREGKRRAARRREREGEIGQRVGVGGER